MLDINSDFEGNKMTLAEMIVSEDPQYAAVRAAYCAGQAKGEVYAFLHFQAAVIGLVDPTGHILRKRLLDSIELQRAQNEHSDIMSWEFEASGEQHESDNPCRTIWQSARSRI